MNVRTSLLLLAISTVNARLQGQRQLSFFDGFLGAFQICHADDDTRYTTQTANFFEALVHVILHEGDRFEHCPTACESLCEDYSFFETTSNSCTCHEEAPEPRLACGVGFAPSSATGACVETCEAPVNPCGPGSACIPDTALGHTCQPQYDESTCPFGCGQHATCVNGTCECEQGYQRPELFLPCKAI